MKPRTKRTALGRRYGRAKGPSGQEVQRHRAAMEAGEALLVAQLRMVGGADARGRELLRGIVKEHRWLLAHCEKRSA